MSYEQKKWVASKEARKAAKEKRERNSRLDREIVALKLQLIEMETELLTAKFVIKSQSEKLKLVNVHLI